MNYDYDRDQATLREDYTTQVARAEMRREQTARWAGVPTAERQDTAGPQVTSTPER